MAYVGTVVLLGGATGHNIRDFTSLPYSNQKLPKASLDHELLDSLKKTARNHKDSSLIIKIIIHRLFLGRCLLASALPSERCSPDFRWKLALPGA